MEPISFFINSSALQQLVHNTPLLIGLSVGGLGLIALIVVFLKRKKKDEEETSAAA